MTLNPYWPAPPPQDTSPLARCGSCVWHFRGGRGTQVDRCRRHGSQPINPDAPPCPAYADALECQACGACCREAYHSVEVSRRDPFVRAHPDLLVEVDGRLTLPRANGRCACLEGQGRFRCNVYDERPRTCRDFERGSENCLTARRRVGLTP